MSYIETEKVELKRVLNDSFEKEVVAFLNSHDGTVYIGVDDDGTIIGVNNVDLLTKNGKYNYQAFILSDQNDLSYKIAQWEGTTKKSKYLFKKEFGNCSVLKAIDDLNPIFNPHIILSDRFLMMEKLPEEMNI